MTRRLVTSEQDGSAVQPPSLEARLSPLEADGSIRAQVGLLVNFPDAAPTNTQHDPEGLRFAYGDGTSPSWRMRMTDDHELVLEFWDEDSVGWRFASSYDLGYVGDGSNQTPASFSPAALFTPQAIVRSIQWTTAHPYINSDVSTSASTQLPDAPGQKINLTRNTTLVTPGWATASDPPTHGQEYTLLLTQDATGGRVVTLPATWKVPSGFTLPTVASTSNILTFIYDAPSGHWWLKSSTLGVPI